jgi:small subunit ribosomal protein S15
MALTQEQKLEIMKEFELHPNDTGSTAVQIAMLTRRIEILIEHLKVHRHDEHTRRGLLKLVGRRRRLLAYLRNNQPEEYKALIQRLGLRR